MRFSSINQAENIKADSESAIIKIITEDKCIDIGDWLSVYGKSDDRQEMKITLLDLEENIVHANIYMRELIPTYKFEI